jgi:YfiH family protein
MVHYPKGWSERVFGEERFWVKTSGKVWTFLGWGPPLNHGTSLTRLRRLTVKAGFPLGSLVCAEQVHGSSIVVLGGDFREDPVRSAGTHDGLMSTTPDCGVVVWTADCVPVLLSGGIGVSAVHAGWRGTVAGILPRTVKIFGRRFGVRPAEISATIGPAVGACHYPVGPEVITALEQWQVSDSAWRRANRIDLRLFLQRQLLDLGLRDSAVEIVGPCTACDRRLASYRRDGPAAGRQISIIGRTADRIGPER